MGFRPGPNLPEQLAIQTGPAQVMQQTGDLILAYTSGIVS